MAKEKATERIELSTPGLRDLCSATETFLFRTDASLAQSVERKALNLVVVCSSPTGGVFPARPLTHFPVKQNRRRQDSNLRGQSPVDFESTPLTAWVRLLQRDKCVSRESNPGRLRGGEPFYH